MKLHIKHVHCCILYIAYTIYVYYLFVIICSSVAVLFSVGTVWIVQMYAVLGTAGICMFYHCNEFQGKGSTQKNEVHAQY